MPLPDVSQLSRGRKIIIGYAQLEALKSLSSGESSYSSLVRQLQGSGHYSSKQQAIRGIEVFVKAQMIEKKDGSDLVRPSPMGKRFLEGLEALFGESES